MKKLLILAAAVFALGTSTVSADNDRPISVSELPEKAQQFIRQHFPNEKVSFAKMERELFDTTYEVIFTSSSKVEFLKNGDWKEVDCKYSTVPAAIIPQQIAQYVSAHFREPLTLEALARALGVSRFHLSHVFSEKIGQGFSAYLASIRVDCACALLAGTNRSVTEIAAESGFESQRSFFRAFGARCGMTPLAYRRRAQGTQAQK